MDVKDKNRRERLNSARYMHKQQALRLSASQTRISEVRKLQEARRRKKSSDSKSVDIGKQLTAVISAEKIWSRLKNFGPQEPPSQHTEIPGDVPERTQSILHTEGDCFTSVKKKFQARCMSPLLEPGARKPLNTSEKDNRARSLDGVRIGTKQTERSYRLLEKAQKLHETLHRDSSENNRNPTKRPSSALKQHKKLRCIIDKKISTVLNSNRSTKTLLVGGGEPKKPTTNPLLSGRLETQASSYLNHKRSSLQCVVEKDHKVEKRKRLNIDLTKIKKGAAPGSAPGSAKNLQGKVEVTQRKKPSLFAGGGRIKEKNAKYLSPKPEEHKIIQKAKPSKKKEVMGYLKLAQKMAEEISLNNDLRQTADRKTVQPWQIVNQFNISVVYSSEKPLK